MNVTNVKENPHKLAVLCATLYAKGYRKHKKENGDIDDRIGYWKKQCAYNKAVCTQLLNRIQAAPEVGVNKI